MTAPTIVQPDNVAVVTGAALGIGRAMCRRFAEAGMSVVVADLPGEELDRTVDALKAISPRGPDRILKAPTDVADPEQVQRLRDTVLARAGKVNLLASNAATVLGEAMRRLWRTGGEPWTVDTPPTQLSTQPKISRLATPKPSITASISAPGVVLRRERDLMPLGCDDSPARKHRSLRRPEETR